MVGGAVGALAMGLSILAMNAPTLAVAIPSLYALAPPPNPAVGMGVHVFRGAVLGVVFRPSSHGSASATPPDWSVSASPGAWPRGPSSPPW